MRYWDSKLVKAGTALLVLGSGPLLLIMAAADLGLTRDPNPNPVAFGILAGLTFWPALILIAVGIVSVSRARSR